MKKNEWTNRWVFLRANLSVISFVLQQIQKIISIIIAFNQIWEQNLVSGYLPNSWQMWPISIRTGFSPWLGWTIVRLGTTLSWSGQRSLKLAVEQHSTRLWPNEFIVLSIHASGNHLNRFMNPSVNNFFCTFELHWTAPAIFVWFGVGFEQSLNRFNKFCHLLTGKGQAKC